MKFLPLLLPLAVTLCFNSLSRYHLAAAPTSLHPVKKVRVTLRLRMPHSAPV